MPRSQTVYMHFPSLGFWRVWVYHQQIQIVYYNDQKLELLITESEHWLSLLPLTLTNRFSEELLSDGRCALSSTASNTAFRWSWMNCPLFQKTRSKTLRWNFNSEASPAQERWPGTIQEPKCSESYHHTAFQPKVTPVACAPLPLNPHFPPSPSDEEALEVSKPWVHCTWSLKDTHYSLYSICG